MKRAIAATALGIALAGCATGDQTGSSNYSISDQPQSAASGEGTLMGGTYDANRVKPGQFTGKEDVSDRVGQYPVTPGGEDADPRDQSRDGEKKGDLPRSEIPPSTSPGAGTLGQSGVQPGKKVSSSTLMPAPAPGSSNGIAATANPPTISTAPTLSQPLTSGAGVIDNPGPTAVGSAPGVQVGNLSSNNPSIPLTPKLPGAEMTHSPVVNQTGAMNSVVPELATRVREVLLSGRPQSITTLTPERLERFDIEAVNGNVTLRGTVGSETERLMIGNKIARIDGVKSVNNQLRVDGPTRPGLDDTPSQLKDTTGLTPGR